MRYESCLTSSLRSLEHQAGLAALQEERRLVCRSLCVSFADSMCSIAAGTAGAVLLTGDMNGSCAPSVYFGECSLPYPSLERDNPA